MQRCHSHRWGIPLAVLLASALAAAAGAATWELEDVEFDDGRIATGSFDYEAGVFSNIHIVTEYNGSLLGREWPGDTGGVCTGSASSIYCWEEESDDPGLYVFEELWLRWDPETIDDEVAFLDLNTIGVEEFSGTSECCGDANEARNIAAGRIVNLPEPSRSAGLAAGVAALLALRSRGRRAGLTRVVAGAS